MYESILRLTDIPWMPMFVAFVTSLLLSAKYSVQLFLGKKNHFRAMEILCALAGTVVVCFLARDSLDWWHAHSLMTPQPLWGVVPIGLAIVASRLHFQFANLKLPTCDLRSSSIVWGVMLCSLGTTLWSAHRLHEEEDRDLDVLVEAEFRMAAGSIEPAEANAATDRGQIVPQFHWHPSPLAAERAAIPPAMQGGSYPAMIITRAAPGLGSNCHGWVFTGGKYVVRSGTVEMILEDNRYQPVDIPQTGDLVVHRSRTSEIQHTGVVRAVLEDGTVIEESKWGVAGGRFLHLSDSQPYGPATYYRSPRQGHLLTTIPIDRHSDAPIAVPKASADQVDSVPANQRHETEETIE
ncbi:MAG: hypothetical protein AABP62_02615 [Planctomycetota bacterium]